MLQGWLENTDILFHLKDPIFVNVHEQDITRRIILKGVIFFSVQNYLSTSDASFFVSRSQLQNYTSLR